MSVCSGSVMLAYSFVASGESNRQSSTFVACSENSAKFTPTPVHVAPSGYGSPGHTLTHGRGSCFVPARELTSGGWRLEARGSRLEARGWGLGTWRADAKTRRR